MKVRDLIDELTSAALSLPAGLDSEVSVGLCHGAERPMEMSSEVDAGVWTKVSPDNRPVPFVLVRGHPHRDSEATRLNPWPPSDLSGLPDE